MYRLLDTLLFTLERIIHHRLLVIWVLAGLAIATTLSLSLSLYVDSVYSELLQSRLDTPPYAFRYRYLGAWNGNISQTDVENASVAVQQSFASTVDLPLFQNVRFVRGGSWTAQMTGGATLNLGSLGIGILDGADSQIMITGGDWPPPESALSDDAPIPVLVPETMLYNMGVQLGDEVTARRAGGGQFTLKIAALWRPVNANDPAWIFPPKYFDQVMLVQPQALAHMLEGIEDPIDEAAWYLVFDGTQVRTADVDSLLVHIVDGQRTIETVLPGIRRDLSPEEGLRAFSAEVNQLTQQLFIIIAPVGGLVIYFVSLVAGLLVSRQQPEDVKLRSRGMSRRGLLTIHILMWLLLVGAALAIGIALSPLIVQLVGETTSFLRFDGDSSPLEIVLTPDAILIGVVTGLISASSGLFLAWRTTRQNITGFRRSSVRATKAWWQRAYLDLLLLGIGGYVFYTLRQQGGLVTEADNPFSDPLTFAGPTVFALGVTLFFLRIWPFLLNIGARLIYYTRSVALLMVLRELTRSISRYRGALLMMSFTLSLTGFTASMASTLDQSLADAINYRVGADLVLVTATDTQTEDEQNADTGVVEQTVTGYNVPPIEELYGIDGIASASRFGRYTGRIVVGGQRVDGTVIGIDRAGLAAAARFREDYASEPLANLLNKLAGNRTGVLLSRTVAEKYNLIPGQEITMQVQALNTWYEARVPIVDFIDYFPTLDPKTGFFLLTNIDPIFEMVGTVLPHDVWLGLEPGADVQKIQQKIQDIGFPVIRWLEPESALRAAQAEPARRGVLGFLSVGFVASITLTLIAAVIQNTASFRAQSMQLGALRAMGLGGLSVAVYVIVLQGMMTLSGVLSGTSIGVATTLLFLPLLDFSGGLPPYLVRVAWGDITLVYSVFAGVLLSITLFTTIMFSRERLATVIRIGE